MKALISPEELIVNPDGSTGFRIADVTDSPFDIAAPLYWIDCDDTVQADVYYFEPNSGLVIIRPHPVIASSSVTQPTSTGTQVF